MKDQAQLWKTMDWKARRRYTRHLIGRHAPIIAYLFLACVIAFSIAKVFKVADVNRIRSKDGRNQTCKLFERQYRNNVRAVSQTYEYIGQLKPDELKDTLNVFIIRNLSQTEQTAKDTVPPTYCDAPGVGLSGVNPSIPTRPKGLLK